VTIPENTRERLRFLTWVATKEAKHLSETSELTGKYMVLDVLAQGAAGHCYNVAFQVRGFGAWHKRGLFYLARTLGGQVAAGEDYQELRASVGLHRFRPPTYSKPPGRQSDRILNATDNAPNPGGQTGSRRTLRR
jgi:hypothetical protein